MASGCGAANIATHFVLASSGYATPFMLTVAAAFREHSYGEPGSHYLLFLEEDCDTMLESADACGVGIADFEIQYGACTASSRPPPLRSWLVVLCVCSIHP